MANKVSKSNISRLSGLRIALVYDDFTQYGGGERLFLAIKELFPKAQIFTSMATKEWIRRLGGRRPHTSFMQRLPFKKKLQRAYFLLYPLAFESFNFSEFDLVISSSTRFAHGVITRPETKHVCYMNSPGRMFWESSQYFGSLPKTGDTRMDSNRSARMYSNLGKLLSPALSYLRLWSYAAAQRVDHFIANSQNIAGKIKRYYRREAEVVYPFVDLERFTPLKVVNSKSLMVNSSKKPYTIRHTPLTSDYYLVVTRLNRWKRVDIAIQAVERLNTRGVKLVVVGDGPERKRLEKLARAPISNSRSSFHRGSPADAKHNSGVEFLGRVSDEELVKLYQGCRALVMTQGEDFGIASLEAQASGRPVIAYGAGGALETVVEGKTGEFFYPQTAEALSLTLKKFKPKKYDPKECRKNAERFSKNRFQRALVSAINMKYEL